MNPRLDLPQLLAPCNLPYFKELEFPSQNSPKTTQHSVHPTPRKAGGRPGSTASSPCDRDLPPTQGLAQSLQRPYLPSFLSFTPSHPHRPLCQAQARPQQYRTPWWPVPSKRQHRQRLPLVCSLCYFMLKGNINSRRLLMRSGLHAKQKLKSLNGEELPSKMCPRHQKQHSTGFGSFLHRCVLSQTNTVPGTQYVLRKSLIMRESLHVSELFLGLFWKSGLILCSCGTHKHSV